MIVGGGTAGCVLANRLSADPNVTVALIEAGPPDSDPAIKVPAMVAKAIGNPRNGWGYLSTPQAAVGQIKGGTVRALAVTSPRRSGALPDLPTMDESGLKGFDMSTWWGVMAPSKVPPEIVTRLSAEIQKALVAIEEMEWECAGINHLAWLYAMNRGVYMTPGREEEWTLSVQHSVDDADRYIAQFAEMARDLTA